MTLTNEPMPYVLIEDLKAPDIYADACVGNYLYNGNVHIALTSYRADFTCKPIAYSHVVVARLVMPAAGMEALAQQLTQFVQEIKAAMVPTPAEPSPPRSMLN